ncbi:MAG: enoyl-CoA hydratase [Pseudomonadota bacterium]
MFNNDIGSRVFAAAFSVAISAIFLAAAIIPGSPSLVA